MVSGALVGRYRGSRRRPLSAQESARCLVRHAGSRLAAALPGFWRPRPNPAFERSFAKMPAKPAQLYVRGAGVPLLNRHIFEPVHTVAKGRVGALNAAATTFNRHASAFGVVIPFVQYFWLPTAKRARQKRP